MVIMCRVVSRSLYFSESGKINLGSVILIGHISDEIGAILTDTDISFVVPDISIQTIILIPDSTILSQISLT